MSLNWPKPSDFYVKSKHLKVLVIAQNLEYVNSTSRLLLRALARRPEIVIAGWRFPESSSSISDLQRRHGRFDVILADLWAVIQSAQPYLRRHVPMDLYEHGIPVLANAMIHDVHAFSAEVVQQILCRATHIVSTVASPQFWCRSFVEAREKELDIYLDGILVMEPRLVNERFVMMPHFVAEDEFNFLPWRQRRYDVSVLGVQYSFREKARDKLRLDRAKRVRINADLFQRGLGTLAVSRQGRRISVLRLLYQHRFRRWIALSRASVTCDASIGYAVRKFFEIPAFGALLAGRFFREPEALGFVDRETAVFLNDPEDIDDLLQFVRSDAAEAERIARRGQEMVREFHTVERRVDQFLEFAAAVASGRSVTTRWRDGRQVIVDTSTAAGRAHSSEVTAPTHG